MALTVESRVKDIRVLQSGESEIVYEETHKDLAGNKLKVPGLFVVSIPLFVGADPSRVIARLRYRKSDGKLSWFFNLYRDDEVLRLALDSAMIKASAETGLPAFEGAPEQV